jgi:hypothetical protein
LEGLEEDGWGAGEEGRSLRDVENFGSVERDA